MKWSPLHYGLIALGTKDEKSNCSDPKYEKQTGHASTDSNWFVLETHLPGIWVYLLPCYQKRCLLGVQGLSVILFPTVLPGINNICFPFLMMRAKVLGPAGALGNQSRLGGSVLSSPRETGLVQGPLGPCLKSGFSHFPLIRPFMAYLEGQGVICLAHVFSFIPSRQS